MPKWATPGNVDALTRVDSVASSQAFLDGPGSFKGLVAKKWQTTTAGTAARVPATPPPAAPPPPAAAPAAPTPRAATQAGAPRPPPAERLASLEQCLLGDGATPQGEAPVQRLSWLEAQIGGTSGTVLQRLDALEAAAQAQGLL
mgnify:CR=1 FL=1